MSAQHTPGPWQLGTTADHTPAVMVATPESEGTGFVVAHVNRPPRMGSVRGDMEANARLIAAAPEMREALGGVAIMLNTALKEYEGEPWAQRVRAALAKAESK